ncbi:GNAT family N-acetyltransferase [Massilia sp. W12]|uniref:GNAT family N-acetyltransferase n=1 Tax=Massilia sp. W12 TaxID=3126507 RepID=UPI0030D01BBA
MPFPCHYTNSETQKTYLVTIGQSGHLTEIKAVAGPHDWGSVDWEIVGNQFLLHTIQSHPAKGTGLGSLLMHLAASEALQANCQRMQILSAAQSERSFYQMMGCTIDTTALASFNQQNFTQQEWAGLSSSCPVVADPSQVLVSSSASVYKRWS